MGQEDKCWDKMRCKEKRGGKQEVKWEEESQDVTGREDMRKVEMRRDEVRLGRYKTRRGEMRRWEQMRRKFKTRWQAKIHRQEIPPTHHFSLKVIKSPTKSQ